jgi:DNA polymerase
LIKPKVICILGRTAYSSLLGGSSITASRGKIVERAGQKYFLTFHPAAVIYNKGLLSALEADLKKLVVEINKEEESEASLEDYL